MLNNNFDDARGLVAENINSIVKRWNKTEARIKEAERISNEAVFPAINELRYAGRRLADILEAIYSENLSENERINRIEYCIAEAEHNCVKADHDVTDAIVFYIHARLRLMIDTFGLEKVVRHFPEYIDIVSKFNAVNQLIVQSREERLKRREIYETISSERLPRLVNLYERMLVSEQLIQKIAVDAADTAYRLDRRKERWTLAISLALAAFGIGMFGLAIFMLLAR